MKLWIVCYDISDAKRLRKVASVVRKYGERVQKSVFECWVEDDLLQQLIRESMQIMKPPRDSLRCYSLCKTCISHSAKFGKTEIAEPANYFIV